MSQLSRVLSPVRVLCRERSFIRLYVSPIGYCRLQEVAKRAFGRLEDQLVRANVTCCTEESPRLLSATVQAPQARTAIPSGSNRFTRRTAWLGAPFHLAREGSIARRLERLLSTPLPIAAGGNNHFLISWERQPLLSVSMK